MIRPFQVTKGVMMRGTDEASGSLFSYVELDERVPVNHPLRLIRRIVNDAFVGLDAEFDALCTVNQHLKVTHLWSAPLGVDKLSELN